MKFDGFVFFDGRARIIRHPGSRISLGSNIRINSSQYSNLIGVNRASILYTGKKGAFIKVGNSCGISGSTIAAFKSVTIGNYVQIGANCLITDSDWHENDYRSGENKSVYIGNNVWLGEGVKVLKGVTIGDNALIGAGSVVTRDVPANVMASGNPCRIKRYFDEDYVTYSRG